MKGCSLVGQWQNLRFRPRGDSRLARKVRTRWFVLIWWTGPSAEEPDLLAAAAGMQYFSGTQTEALAPERPAPTARLDTAPSPSQSTRGSVLSPRPTNGSIASQHPYITEKVNRSDTCPLDRRGEHALAFASPSLAAPPRSLRRMQDSRRRGDTKARRQKAGRETQHPIYF
jgi:hypothetical protein